MGNSEAHILQTFKFFNDLGEQLATASSIQQAAQIMVRFLNEALDLRSVALWLFDSQRNTFEHYEHYRHGEPFSPEVRPILSDLAQQVLNEPQPYWLSFSEHGEGGPLQDALRSQNVSGVMALPMAIGDQRIGVLFAFLGKERRLVRVEVQKLAGCAAVMAAMIFQLNTVAESQRRAWELSTLIEAAQVMVSTLDLAELLQKIAMHLIKVSGADHCAISAYEPRPPRLITMAQYRASGEVTPELAEGVFYLKDYPLTDKLMRNGEVGIVRVDDPQADPAEVKLLKLEQHHVLYMFRLDVSGTPVGLLELYSDKPGYQLSEDRIQQVQTLAKVIANALNNARLYSREQRARLTAEMLRQSAEALNSTLELDRVLALILEELQQVVHYDSASLMLLERGYLRILAVRGHPFPEVALQVRFDVSKNELASMVIRRRQYLILEDAQRDERFMRLGKANHVRGWMGIPMIARDEVIGMLTLDSRAPAAYTTEDAEIAMAFANQAAFAIHNARLYQSEREQRTLAEVLREISLTLSSTLEPTGILKTLLEQVERVVPYDSACVMLLEGDEVRIAAHRGYERFGVAHLMDDFRMTLSRTPNLLKMSENRQPYFIANVKSASEWEVTGVDEHIGSWLGAPLIAQERLIGFLSLDKVEPGFYSEWHANCLANLAGHAALALRNALAFGEAERAAITDFLTGAYNHRYFHEEIHHELERARRLGYPVSLLMLDLDRFKSVNDRYGHQIGDRVLQWVVNRLKGELRLTDVLARYGGEEFTVILPGTPVNYLTEVAERLRCSIKDQPFQIDNYVISITVSIGGATYPDHAEEVHDLIACADRALYQAKRDGRNCVRLFASPTVETSH